MQLQNKGSRVACSRNTKTLATDVSISVPTVPAESSYNRAKSRKHRNASKRSRARIIRSEPGSTVAPMALLRAGFIRTEMFLAILKLKLCAKMLEGITCFLLSVRSTDYRTACSYLQEDSHRLLRIHGGRRVAAAASEEVAICSMRDGRARSSYFRTQYIFAGVSQPPRSDYTRGCFHI